MPKYDLKKGLPFFLRALFFLAIAATFLLYQYVPENNMLFALGVLALVGVGWVLFNFLKSRS